MVHLRSQFVEGVIGAAKHAAANSGDGYSPPAVIEEFTKIWPLSLRIADCGLRIWAVFRRNLHSKIRNPQSAIQNNMSRVTHAKSCQEIRPSAF